MEDQKEKRLTYLIIGIVCAAVYAFLFLFLLHIFIVQQEQPQLTTSEVITEAVNDFTKRPFAVFPIPKGAVHTILIYTLVAGLLIFLVVLTEKEKAHYNTKTVDGDAEWLKDLDTYNRKYTDPLGKTSHDGPTNTILSQDLYLTMNNWKTGKNLNTFIIGGSGAGKSFNYVGPNIMQANASFVITDPSGGLFKQYGYFLEYMGYKVKCFNLDHMEQGNHYNPFCYIRDDQDVEILVNTLIQNTTPPESKSGDPFWEKSETALLVALVAYLYHYAEKSKQTFTNVMKLLRMADVDENNTSALSQLDYLFQNAEKKDPNSFAVKQYKTFKMGAGKTLKSILISCAVRLQKFDLEPVARLTSQDDLDLDSVGDEKSALFVIIPTGDTTFSFLSSMMYSQLFQRLYRYCENTAEYSQCVMDSDNQIWKTFRASGKEDAEKARVKAEKYFERAKNSRIVENETYHWYEIRTKERNELVGYRGTRKLAEEALQKLREGRVIANAEQSNNGQRLPIHTRFLLDEFANTGKIPSFSEKVATIRKYEISVAIVVQSIQQMKNLYKDDWETLAGNCDNTIFLGGGADTVTAEWISKLLGKETRVVMNVSYSKNGGSQSLNRTGVELYSVSQLRTMPADKCLVIPSRMNAFLGKKYNSTKHPNWNLVTSLQRERGAFYFDPAKTQELYLASRTSEATIQDKHGDVEGDDTTVRKQINADEKQQADEIADNCGADGQTIASPGKPLTDEGTSETLPVTNNQSAEDLLGETILANDNEWAADKLLYGGKKAQNAAS